MSLINDMAVDDDWNLEEQERQDRRREKIRQMRLEKERILKRRRLLMTRVPVAAAALLLIVFIAISVSSRSASDSQTQETSGAQSTESSAADASETVESAAETAAVTDSETGASEVSGEADTAPYAAEFQLHSAQTTESTAVPPEEVNSTNVIFIDLESGDILAERGSNEIISPASMTKVLTLLVAAEHITDLDDTFTMTIEITDYSYSNDCSSVGFSVGEVITVRDMLYGTILPSGGDAAVALATYVAGSHEAFVELMNDKLEQLGLSDTAHFTNCVGLYDADHYCTVYDMAMIMEAALDNELCREVLSAHTYTTSATTEHPKGITISNWFLRRIEDKDTGGEVICAKTGYVDQSGSCAVSYGVDASGREYVCATTGAHSSWRCIYDHVALYSAYAAGSEEENTETAE